MKIYIMTDMEGCAGILNHDDWVLPTGRWYEEGRRLLTGEVNAAIEGMLEGGATEILVLDGHGAGGIDPVALHPAAELAVGLPHPAYPLHLDGSFDGLSWVGQHAKAGTDWSHITHTQWFDRIDCSVNGISIGEYGQTALCGMELGVPAFFAAGEEALCLEAEALTPGVVTVSVKRGVLNDGLETLTADEYRRAKLAAVHRSPTEARRRIRAGALEATRKLARSTKPFQYPPLRPPYHLRQSLRSGAGRAPRVQEASHAESVIAALNAPWKDVVGVSRIE